MTAIAKLGFFMRIFFSALCIYNLANKISKKYTFMPQYTYSINQVHKARRYRSQGGHGSWELVYIYIIQYCSTVLVGIILYIYNNNNDNNNNNNTVLDYHLFMKNKVKL